MGKLDYRTLRENVADEIRMKILNGDMKPGDKIIEQELASEFGISRGPVREALRQLEQEGMVEYSRNVGCSVKHIGMDDVYEIYYMRANYEMMAVRLYNAPFPRETIEKMEQVLEQMKQLHKEEYRKVFELDNKFHETLYQASGSKVLANVLTDFHNYVQRVRKMTLKSKERAEKSNDEHRMIAQAIHDHDPEKAQMLANQHIMRTIENIDHCGWDNLLQESRKENENSGN